jgi:phosphoglycolate phosphatase
MDAMTDRTIVFDLDGTLADTAGDLIAALNSVLASERLPPLPVDKARTLIGHGGRDLIRRGFAEDGRQLSTDKLETLFRAFLEFYDANIAVHTKLYPGVMQALDDFAKDDWRLAICTNKIERMSKKLVAELGVSDRFAFISGQDTFGVLKPDPIPLLKTIGKVGGTPERAIMVGDSISDVGAARSGGVKIVGVDFGYTDIHMNQLGPDRVISHFDDLHEAANALLP